MNRDVGAAAFARQLALSAVAHSVVLEASLTQSPIATFPVRLEPVFTPLDPSQTFSSSCRRASVASSESVAWVLHHWMLPASDVVDWRRAEAALAGLTGCVGPFAFEVHCRRSSVSFYLGVPVQHASFARSAWLAAYPESALVVAPDPMLGLNDRAASDGDLVLFDLYAAAPYHRSLRTNQVLSPWRQFLGLSAALGDDDLLFCQVLFCPARQPWQQNVLALLEAERSLGARSPFGRTSSAQAKDISEPFFTAVIRLGATQPALASSIEAFAGSYLSDGQSFRYRSIDDFRAVLSDDQILGMLQSRSSHTTGQFLTSSELAMFVHAPDRPGVRAFPLQFLEGLCVPSRLRVGGVPLGVNQSRGVPVEVFQPESLQHNRSTWLIGASRMGKSSMIAHRVRFFAASGRGVGLIDPHRTTAFDVLGALGDVDPDRVVFLDFDHDVPVAYNPFVHDDERDYGRLTTEFVHSLKHLFDAAGFHRMAHFLGNAIYALFVLKANLATLPMLFAKSPLGEELRRQVTAGAKNSAVRRFWSEEYNAHGSEAFAPIMNRLSALLLDDRTLRTFSQPENRVHVAGAMDEGKIVIVAPPASIDAASIVGGMLIAQAKHAAFRRTGTKRAAQHFHLVIDEFHRFITSGQTLQSIIDEAAKGGLSVCLANQETGQIPTDLLKAMYSIPNIFVFGVNLLDAKQLAQLFNGDVSPATLASQTTGQVHARIAHDRVSFDAHAPIVDADPVAVARIIEHSHRHYYATAIPGAPPVARRMPRIISTLSEE